MRRIVRSAVVSLMIVSLTLVPMAGTIMAADEIEKKEISADQMAADLVLVRPLGFISMVTGSVLFLFSLPFSFSEDSMDQNRKEVGTNLEKLIVEPSKFTFNRRLGDM